MAGSMVTSNARIVAGAASAEIGAMRIVTRIETNTHAFLAMNDREADVFRDDAERKKFRTVLTPLWPVQLRARIRGHSPVAVCSSADAFIVPTGRREVPSRDGQFRHGLEDEHSTDFAGTLATGCGIVPVMRAISSVG